jgi:two-component system chemotaxis response regulator CheB
MAGKIRVLIVDDSALMREALKSIIEQDPGIEVVGMANNGREGVEKSAILKPDVITMDLKMPMMSGLEATETIMEDVPIPIIVVSGMDITVIVKALSIGAMDFVAVTSDIETIAADLISKIKIASRVKPLKRIKIKPCAIKAPEELTGKDASKVVAIGVSTGGPQALQQVFAKLPPDFSCGILVVQHMSKGFIEGLAEWLNTTSCLHVSVARAGDALRKGQIMLAPDDLHMRIGDNGKIILSENTDKTIIHVPSIDVMMKSVADSYGENAVGVIMTGMGQDGVEGMRAIRAAGGRTIAQNENTSVIFGMNKVAIDMGLVDKAVALERMADELTKIVSEIS